MGGATTVGTGNAIFRRFLAVRVVRVSDDAGLNLRVIVVMPSDDVLGGLQQAAAVALFAPGIAIALLCVAVAVILGSVFEPLSVIEATLTRVAAGYSSTASQGKTIVQVAADYEAMMALGSHHTRFREITKINDALMRLLSELKLLRTFFTTRSAG